MGTTKIKLEQLITEPASTPRKPTDNNDFPQDSVYELLRDALDNCFTNKTQTTSSKTENTPEYHHTKLRPCDDQKQPL